MYLNLLSKYEGRVRGDEYWVRCPWHNESKPSLSININTGAFFCFGCKRGPGEWLDRYIAESEGISMTQANSMIMKETMGAKKRNGVTSFQFINERQIERFFPIESKPYMDYLKSRGLSKALAQEFDVREGNPSEPMWNNRIIYAIRNDKGKIASIEGRAINGDPLSHYNEKDSRTSLGLFGIDRIEKKLPWLFIVEGPIDCMSLAKLKIPSVAMCTSSISKTQAKMLYRLAEYPIVLLDGLRKGTKKARDEVIKQIRTAMYDYFHGDFGIHTIRRQETDPNDLLKKNALKNYIDNVLRENKLKRGKIQWQKRR